MPSKKRLTKHKKYDIMNGYSQSAHIVPQAVKTFVNLKNSYNPRRAM
jgi:hypothetical protein